MFRQQRTTDERGTAVSSGRVRSSTATRRTVQVIAVAAVAGLVLTGCATKSDKNAAASAGDIPKTVTTALAKEGPIQFLDHSYASSTVQAEVLSQVLNAMGANTKVTVMGDIAAAFPAVAKDASIFDPEQWRMLEEPQFQKYVDNGGSVVSYAKSLLTGEEGWYVPTYVIKGDPKRGIKPTCPGLPDYKALNDCVNTFKTARTGEKGQFMSISKAYEPAYGDYDRIKNLGLDYQVEFAGSTSALDAEWKRAYDKGEPFLALAWKPTYTGLKYDITQVKFPPYTPQCWGKTYACGWGEVGIQSLANPDFATKYPEAARIIKNYNLNDSQMLEILTSIQEQGLEPEAAVAQWVKDNPKVWQAWAS